MKALLDILNPYRWLLLAGITAALFAAVWWWHSGQLADARAAGVAAGRAQVKADWDRERDNLRAAAEKARKGHAETKERNDARVIQSQSGRAQATARDHADLRRVAAERDSLRQLLTTALDSLRSCELPGPAADAAANRAAAVDAVLEDLERAGAEMARAASGHAADSLMYQQAWPRERSDHAQDP